MKAYELRPQGLLFFRDARPLDHNKDLDEYQTIGHGAYWPRPDHLYHAVMHGVIQDRDCPESAYGQFGGVQVTGPFPKRGGITYFPRPLDWDMDILPCEDTDLPAFLTHGFIDRTEGKKNYPAWISYEDLQGYLQGELPKDIQLPEEALFLTEPHIGTTLDPRTGASKRVEGKQSGQYHAEYLRLGKDVSMVCEIETGKEKVEIPREFIMGGQGGIVSADTSSWRLSQLFPAPKIPQNGPINLRWTLLTPAYFSQTGWLPGWCHDTTKAPVTPQGDITWKPGDGPRKEQPMDRAADGVVMFPDCMGCKLIAACVGKPIYFSGWIAQKGAKPTCLAVPAGSAYVFSCPDASTAQALVNRLHLGRYSDFGSQGYGIGICSFVDI